MEKEDSNTIEEDPIEWVSGTSTTVHSRKVARHSNALEVPLRQIYFINSTNHQLSELSEGSMALFLHDKTLKVSICLNDMKDEISFRIREVEEFKMTRGGSIMFKFRQNFIRMYYHHPEGYSFEHNSVLKNSDPTGGKLSGVSTIDVKPNDSVDRDDLNFVDKLIQRMIDKSRNNRVSEPRKTNNNDFRFFNNSKIPPVVRKQKDSPSSDYIDSNSDDVPHEIFPERYKNVTERRELYITCIYPTQKRAIIYSSDGILDHFQFHIRQRFDWKWERMWHKNKTGGWNILNCENTWMEVKKQAMNKPIPRIEVFMR